MSAARPKGDNRYSAIIERIFFAHWKEGETEFEFDRSEIKGWAATLGIELPDNLGDLIYSFRFRSPLPARIRETEPSGMQWHIQLAGRSRYRFRLARGTRILPRENLLAINIPDATPELIRSFKLDDEQALLAIVRYNRLVDVFLGLTTYSLQNHLRTTVKGMGQIEIDELYVGIDTHGVQYIVPVQAKGGSDQNAIVQTEQDIFMCAEKFPGTVCRAISVQFMDDDVVAMFELTLSKGEVKVVEERHYKLVPAEDPNRKALRTYLKKP
ncbi:MAG TPA: hypothetical protein VG889_17220 [Rhizomicrobium sp.]|nr:hypothetical protein [Rhizomicrobium sp.]